MTSSTAQDEPPSERLQRMMAPDSRIQELSDTSGDEGGDTLEATTAQSFNGAPALFCTLPLLRDSLQTKTSKAQDKVAETCRQYMTGEELEFDDPNSHGVPYLQIARHIKFLRKGLGRLPEQYQAADASRPWMIYWGLAGLASLGEEITEYREDTIKTFMPLQNKDGGFGGGHGQISHAAAGYAATLSLAIVGGLEMVNRRTMWSWLGNLKQPDGGFAMAIDGEIDIRGAYCCMTIISLLNLPHDLPPECPARRSGLTSFTDRLGDWIGRCQTYEGGIGAAPDNEAHGAYAFCGLACLSILDAPHRSVPRYLNIPRLRYWLASRQTAPEGGFSGRTNKLVDACYSHWVGGCWALLDAATSPRPERPTWNRDALVRYTLCCSQAKAGGLRDKPSARQDSYHTCYSLAGMSAAQNHWMYKDGGKSGDAAPYQWYSEPPTIEDMMECAFDFNDTVAPVHPVFVIPLEAVAATKVQFEHVVGF